MPTGIKYYNVLLVIHGIIFFIVYVRTKSWTLLEYRYFDSLLIDQFIADCVVDSAT